jgi:hypothetical protein
VLAMALAGGLVPGLLWGQGEIPAGPAWTLFGGNPSSLVDGGVISRAAYGFYWETRVEPPQPGLGEGFQPQTAERGDAIRRMMFDPRSRTYFGYDVVVEVGDAPGSYRVTFQPFRAPFEATAWSLPGPSAEWTALPSPRFPPTETVRAGEVLALELLANTDTGQRIVDYVTIQEPSRSFQGFDAMPDRQFAFATGPARDFRAEDVELRIQAARVRVNGLPEASADPLLPEISGPLVWFYFPGRGRFVLSLVPRPELGFERRGEVRGTLLEFTVGGDLYALSSGVRIAPGQAVFNLYVRHDPGWLPSYPFANTSRFTMGSAPNAGALGLE